MIKFVKGNIFDSKTRVLVNPVNCVGVMGKGLAKQFRDRNWKMFQDYRSLCNDGVITPGYPYLWGGYDNDVLLFPTKDLYTQQSKLEYIESGLLYFRDWYKQWGIESIAFPALGCGCGGLKWSDVRPLMIRMLDDLPIDIEIYEP